MRAMFYQVHVVNVTCDVLSGSWVTRGVQDQSDTSLRRRRNVRTCTSIPWGTLRVCATLTSLNTLLFDGDCRPALDGRLEPAGLRQVPAAQGGAVRAHVNLVSVVTRSCFLRATQVVLSAGEVLFLPR